MEIVKFIQTEPLIFKNDPILHVIKLMERFSLIEIPVIDGKNLLGTLSSSSILQALKKFDVKDILAHHLIAKNFIKVKTSTSLKKLVKQFLKKKNYVACVSDGNFKGYVRRVRLLETLLTSKEEIKRFVSTKFAAIDADESIKALDKILDGNLPLVILKDKEPLTAFSVEELRFSLSVNDYVVRSIERDFETQRAEERKLLRLRLHQQLLSFLKGETDFIFFHPLTARALIDRAFVLTGKESVGEVAKLMLELNKTVLPIRSKRVVTDLALLSELR